MRSPSPAKRRGRPPSHPDGPGEARDLLVRAGVAALTEKGFTATGLDGLLKSVGIPKGSFYHYFESKEAFGLVLIEEYATYFGRKLDRWLLDGRRPPSDRLRDFIEDAKAGLVKYAFRRGCLVGNLGQEILALPESYAEALCTVFASWEMRVATCLSARHARRSKVTDAQDRRLAAFFWIGWEGAVLRARLACSTAPLDIFAAEFLARLG